MSIKACYDGLNDRFDDDRDERLQRRRDCPRRFAPRARLRWHELAYHAHSTANYHHRESEPLRSSDDVFEAVHRQRTARRSACLSGPPPIPVGTRGSGAPRPWTWLWFCVAMADFGLTRRAPPRYRGSLLRQRVLRRRLVSLCRNHTTVLSWTNAALSASTSARSRFTSASRRS